MPALANIQGLKHTYVKDTTLWNSSIYNKSSDDHIMTVWHQPFMWFALIHQHQRQVYVSLFCMAQGTQESRLAKTIIIDPLNKCRAPSAFTQQVSNPNSGLARVNSCGGTRPI